MSLFDRLFYDLFLYVNQNLNLKMDILECNQIRQVLLPLYLNMFRSEESTKELKV